MRITLSKTDLEVATTPLKTRRSNVVAMGCGDKTYVSGTQHGLPGDKDNILGILAINKILDFEPNLDYSRNTLQYLPSGKSFVVCTTPYHTGSVLRNPKGTDAHADYYLLVIKISDTKWRYAGYCTHDKLYGQLGPYRNLGEMYYYNQEQLDQELPI